MADKVVAIKIDVQGTADQKRKLEGLEKTLQGLTVEQKKLKKQLKDGAITRNQYAQSIAKVNLGLKGTRRQLLVTRQAMLGIDGFTTRLGKSFARLGTSISGAFIGLFAVQKLFEVVASGIKTIEEFEQQMAKVRAVSGATSVEFKALTESAKTLGRTSLFTSTDVGKLQEELAKLGFTTPQILDSAEAILQLATATGTELAQASEVAASTINAFGLEAKDAQDIVDLMAESFSSTPLDINKFQESMKLVAPTAKSVGQSVQETTAQLGLLAKSGISGSIAGTQLSRVFIELNKKGITLKDAIAQVANSTNKLGTATELVGDRGAKALQIFAAQSGELNTLTDAFKDSTGEAKKMADIVGDTAVGAAKKLESAWEGLTLTLGEGSEKGFAAFKLGFADFLNDVTDFVEARDKLSTSGVSTTIGDDYFGLSSDQADNIDKINKEQKFLNNNLKDREALLVRQKELRTAINVRLKEEFSDENRRKRRADELTDAEEDRLIYQKNQRRIEQTALQNLEKQLKALGEVAEAEDLKAKEAQVIAELNAGQSKKLTQEELNELEKKNAKILEETKKKNAKIERSDKRLAEQVRKLKQEQLVLEIEDKRKAEFQKLTFSEQNAIREVDLTVSTEQQKTDAILAIQSKFNAQRQVLARKNANEDAKTKQDGLDKEAEENKKRLDKAAKLKEDQDAEKKAFEDQVLGEKIALAEQTATALVDVTNRKVEREKNIELANLDAKLQQGLISQADFEKEKEAIERKAFNKQKKLEIAQIAISLAREIASIAANSAGNPLNAFTGGGAGAVQNRILAGLAVARSGIQAGIVASQSFAEGGYTGGGVGTPDATGFKQAGVVHEGEYVVPKNVLESNGGSRLVGALESMRNNRPQPYLSAGFANGGFSSGGSGLDLTDMENRISKAVVNSIGSIPVVNVATETTTQANRVNNIQSEATFG
jgi:hypothetical protein